MSFVYCVFLSGLLGYGDILGIHPEDGDDGVSVVAECEA